MKAQRQTCLHAGGAKDSHARTIRYCKLSLFVLFQTHRVWRCGYGNNAVLIYERSRLIVSTCLYHYNRGVLPSENFCAWFHEHRKAPARTIVLSCISHFLFARRGWNCVAREGVSRSGLEGLVLLADWSCSKLCWSYWKCNNVVKDYVPCQRWRQDDLSWSVFRLDKLGIESSLMFAFLRSVFLCVRAAE